MFNKFIIVFFYLFLISRYFSEKLKVLPKWVDLINFGLFIVLILLMGFYLNRKNPTDGGESVYIMRVFSIFSVTFLISILFNQYYILPLASILFYMGFMEGPILFIALNKISKDKLGLANWVSRIFFVILILNIFVIILLDIPEFLITGNPDVISGTYGNNTYQFSMVLLICGGYLLGYNYVKKYRTWIVVVSQIVILVIFYLSQFRAGLPFFLVSFFLMIGFLYGKRIILKIIPILIFLGALFSLVVNLTVSDDKIAALKFDDWVTIVSEPQKFLTFGKFKIYQNVGDMWGENPQNFIIGTGPGNFLSRANTTFSYELTRSDKGVAILMRDVFGITNPNFTYIHNKYVRNSIKNEAIFGTWQLSSPNTSYLSAITEIGIIGGISIVILYIYLIIKSIKFIRIIKERRREFVPLSIALIGGTSYLFGLAFLDNYWEIARVTLPVWLLFWAVKTIAYSTDEEYEKLMEK